MRDRSAARALVLSALAVAATAAAPGAQQTAPPPPTPPAQEQLTFRARVDSVSVDVGVMDRQGRPVTDLTVADFEIREDNKVQKIDTFKFIEVVEAPPEGAVRRDILSSADHERETSRPDTRLLVIFLDDYHVRRSNSMRVREQLAAFASRLTPSDLVAVTYPLLSSTAMTFSYNHDATARMLMSFEGRKYDYTPRNPVEDRYQMLSPEGQEQMRNSITISALESVCAYVGSLRDGRKTILYVSEGMSGSMPAGVRTTGSLNPFGRTTGTPPQLEQFASFDLASQLREVFVAASRSNTSIYTLDPRGLAGSEFDISDSTTQEADRRVLNESTDVLRIIASETDGRAIVGRNDPAPSLRQMLRDQSAYYLLGYTSSIGARDGKFHEIQVRVKRRDVEVRARKGYWAWTAEDVERAAAPAKPLPPRDVMDALEALSAVAEPGRRRPVSVWMGAARGVGDANVVTFAWEVPAAAPGTVQDPTEVVDHVTVTAHSMYGDLLFKGSVARESSVVGRVAGRATFDAPAGAVSVRFVAENARGRRLDADDASLVVPDFATPALTVSTPFVYRGRTARELQLVRSAAASGVPTVTRVFSRTERLLVRFQVVNAAGAPPTVTMRLLNQRGDALTGLPDPGKAADGFFDAEVGLGPLPPGDYILEMNAADGEQKTRTLLAIRVTG